MKAAPDEPVAGMGSPADPTAPPFFGLATAVFIVVSSMVGTGVLTTSGFTVYLTGSNQAMLILWVVGGLLAVCRALSIAEPALTSPPQAKSLEESPNQTRANEARWSGFRDDSCNHPIATRCREWIRGKGAVEPCSVRVQPRRPADANSPSRVERGVIDVVKGHGSSGYTKIRFEDQGGRLHYGDGCRGHIKGKRPSSPRCRRVDTRAAHRVRRASTGRDGPVPGRDRGVTNEEVAT